MLFVADLGPRQVLQRGSHVGSQNSNLRGHSSALRVLMADSRPMDGQQERDFNRPAAVLDVLVAATAEFDLNPKSSVLFCKRPDDSRFFHHQIGKFSETLSALRFPHKCLTSHLANLAESITSHL